MPLLAVETSCDETSAAVIEQGRVLSNIVSSQVRLHAEYGGVVPELAAREHLRNWMPVTRAALEQAGIRPEAIDAVAATQGPGLPNALLIGLRAAQAFAFALGKPFVGIHHHEAHLYSPWLSGSPLAADFDAFTRNVSLIVSGGHTLLVEVRSELNHTVLGGTVDDAAGECFDKVGKLLGLGYPGGVSMDRLSEGGHAERFVFPRPLLKEKNDNFSFAGLKTSVRYFLQKNPELIHDAQALKDLCASVQAAIVDVLVTKTVRAAQRVGARCLTASGGVTCNRALRKQLAAATRAAGLDLRLAEPSVCTDNAAMIGILAERKLLRGHRPPSTGVEVLPGWRLEELGRG